MNKEERARKFSALVQTAIEEFWEEVEVEIKAAFRLEIQWLEDNGCDLFDADGVNKVTVDEFLEGKLAAIRREIGLVF